MKNFEHMIIAACVISTVIGIALVIQFHIDYIQPMDNARRILLHVQSVSNSQTIHDDLVSVQRLLPASGNPNWMSHTSDTDFGLIQNDLNTMLTTDEKIESISPDSITFQTGMTTIHYQSSTIVFNLLDAAPYMYVSLSFILANALWILGVVELVRFVGVKKK